MVLYKRKPVQFIALPTIYDESQDVWHIPETGEIFETYEEYLERLDFYKQPKFICQISGQSRLTFFEALASELTGAAEVEEAFPEALKGPILRRVQFQTVSRIDTLVDMIYEEFKSDYYPGENVACHVITGERVQGVVRDKSRFGSRMNPDGSMAPPFSRYVVSIAEEPEQEAVVDDGHISRDRKLFTKAVLRSFIKKTVTREAWSGAPWLVRHNVAAQYQIDTRVPQHLRYDNKLLERKNLQAQKRMENGVGNLFAAAGGQTRLPELKPAPKNHKTKHAQGDGKGRLSDHGDHHSINDGDPFQYTFFRDYRTTLGAQAEPAPPPPKYPIEDLQVPLRDLVRPALSFMCKDAPSTRQVNGDTATAIHDQILMRSVGPLLETWDTLNVYCEIFKLDSFTFDDFVETLSIASEETPVELFNEIHCAVLKVLVHSESDGGAVQFKLPELEPEENGEAADEEADEVEAEPEPAPKPTGRATRSSMAKMEAERLAAEAAAAEQDNESEPLVVHRAEEALKDYDWIDQLRKRAFGNGGWELMVVGLLHQLSKQDRYKTSCESILSQLTPPDVEATPDTVRQHYATLDINTRVEVLQIICMLTTETKAIRGYMEDCSDQMTAYRKEKIDWQRQRKQAIEELKALNEERKILLPDNLPPSPPLGPIKVKEDGNISDAEDLIATTPEEIADSDDQEPQSRGRGRGLRRADDRAAQRKRKREEDEERKKEAEAAAKVPKQSKAFIKVNKDIQAKKEVIKKCEDEIAVLDNDLREADCPRTRVLGKDRFWNRYYWFERNGMPYGGLPNSSTASAGYANGCIWVQGPDDLERLGYIDLPSELQDEYVDQFNLTVPERKKKEEGATSVRTATEWGYYSDPEDVAALVEWLDPRGFNEVKLRKEIVTYQDRIVEHMAHRKEYIRPVVKKEKKKEEKEDLKRMSTRTRAVQSPEPPQYRCLQWHNTMALEELGYIHSEQPAPVRPRKQVRKKETIEIPEIMPKKRLSRQGTRYNF